MLDWIAGAMATFEADARSGAGAVADEESWAAGVQAFEMADGLLSAAVLGDRGLTWHRFTALVRCCLADPRLGKACGRRLQQQATAPFFKVHMALDMQRSQLNLDVQQMIDVLLSTDPSAGCKP